MKLCARCDTPIGNRKQASICGACSEVINAPVSNAKQYTAGELAEVLSTLPLEDRELPVIVGSQFDGPAKLLIIEVCRPENEAPYVWIGDPDA